MTTILRSRNDILKIFNQNPLCLRHFVPTMGSLHEGHISLIRKAKKQKGKTFVSIFVNPIQFEKVSDFNSYPKNIYNDIKILKNFAIDYIFIPNKNFISSNCSFINVNSFDNILCARDRPNHFNGVATIIIKFLNLIKPDYIYLGEKDYQQILVIKKIIKDFSFSTRVSKGKIIRESDGLAFSSRNRLLSTQQRKIAYLLYKKLKLVKKIIISEYLTLEKLEEIKLDLLKKGFKKVNYFEIRKEKNLEPIDDIPSKSRIFISANLDKIRLIDNLDVGSLVRTENKIILKN